MFPTRVENMGERSRTLGDGEGGIAGELFKIWWGEAWVYKWGEHEELKTVLKNACEGAHLLVKLPAVSLQILGTTDFSHIFFNDFR